MKRSCATSLAESDPDARSEAVRPCPVPPDAVLALLDDADCIMSHLLVSLAAVACLTADMGVRKDDSVKLARGEVDAALAALVESTKRVAYCAKRRARLASKHADADSGLLAVTAKQLGLLKAAVTPDQFDFAFEGVSVGCAAMAPQALPWVQVRAVEAMGPTMGNLLVGLRGAGTVATADGLRVMNAAGPGLKWFVPHSRNEFSVVLAQADGCVPVWLTTGDVALSASTAGSPIIDTYVSTIGVGGSVSLTYRCGSLHDDAPEAALSLTVGGVCVGDGTGDGDGDWIAHVPRKPLAGPGPGHECAAVGTLVRNVCTAGSSKCGLAVSADEKWLVVGLIKLGELFVQSLPGGELVRTFGGAGDGPLQFKRLTRLCFARSGHVIVVDSDNRRLQEVTLEGVFVRFIGVGEFGDSNPFCVAVHDDFIAVGCQGGTGPRVALFVFDTGAVMSRFGEVGTAPGQLSNSCTGIRFTPDCSHVIVAEHEAGRVSLFTTAGVFERCVGVGVLGAGLKDTLQSVTGEYVVADTSNNCVRVFSRDGSELVRSWGVECSAYISRQFPTALAAAGPHLYVVNFDGGRVQVFE